MPALTAIYIDFQCAYSYRAWRWLGHLPERAEVEVRPYCLDACATQGGRRRPWDEGLVSMGLELLALGEFARDVGREAHHAYVDAAFEAVNDPDRDMSGIEAWLALGASVGLDMPAFTADHERWRAEVGLWHEEGIDECGVFGVPTLVIDGAHALYLRLAHDVRNAAEARALLGGLLTVGVAPVAELRRTA